MDREHPSASQAPKRPHDDRPTTQDASNRADQDAAIAHLRDDAPGSPIHATHKTRMEERGDVEVERCQECDATSIAELYRPCPKAKAPPMRVPGIHGRLYKALLRLIPDLLSLQPGTARISRSAGWMDLHLDVLEVEAEPGRTRWLRVALAHYYESRGDLVSDPDMELRVCLDPSYPAAEALNITQGGLGIYREVYPAPGLVNPRAKKELNDFLAVWLRNARDQGHRLGPETGATA